jgi:ATP-dependent helicase/nuclease subunit A
VLAARVFLSGDLQMRTLMSRHEPRALTGEQEEAVARRGESLMLSAGAGSGKTSVLVERFARAVLEDGVAPGRILAITFTERAAEELRERVAARLQNARDREAARALESAFVGTFHGFCARLLRANAVPAGIDANFAILQERIAGWLRAQALELALTDFLAGEHGEAIDLIAAYGAERAAAITSEVYATLRSKGERAPRLPELVWDEAGAGEMPGGAIQYALFGELLERFDLRYEQLKRRRGALDFDDLELIASGLLSEHEGTRTATAERFDLIMVDEFQDCNARELAIVQALERDNVFTVGDEQQAIYGFRHADVRLFRARRDALAQRGASVRLTENFRSRGAILEVVNALFAARLGDGHAPLVAAREEEGGAAEPRVELLLTAKRGWEQEPAASDSRTAALGRSVPLWRIAEARALAARVYELVHGGEVRAGEVAVLLRALGDAEVYEAALRERGLRTIAPAGSFWSREQVADLLAYLRVLANPLDEPALYATLFSPLAGVSRAGLTTLALHARERRRSVWSIVSAAEESTLAALGAEDRDALLCFGEWLERERATMRERTISRVLERALDARGYREYVLALADGGRRLANVNKLLAISREFEAHEGRELRRFLDYAARLAQGGGAGEPDAPPAGEAEDAVTLMSIHAAKGLEFGVVCLADLGRAPNQGVPDLLVDEGRVGLRLVGLDGEEPVPALDFAALSEQRRADAAQEEDRILYVAMTRARERLLLSGALDLGRAPSVREGAPAIAWLVRAIDPGLCAGEQSGDRDIALGEAREATVRCRLNLPRGVAAETPSLDVAGAARKAAGVPGESGEIVASRGVARPARIARVRQRRSAHIVADAGSLSYTALAELERCAYRFYLERSLGLGERPPGRERTPAAAVTEPDAADLARGTPSRARTRAYARARGTLVHRVLELADLHDGAGTSDEDIDAAARTLGMRLAPADKEEISRLVRRASAPATLFERLKAARSVHREHAFALTLTGDTGDTGAPGAPGSAGETLITGVIDVLARELGGGALIVDYKTDAVDADSDLVEIVEREYSLQRLIYALALLRDGAEEVEIVHWFLEREDGCVVVRYAASERAQVEERLRARLLAAKGRGFAPSETPHRALCETCPGRRALCSWGESETMRERPAAERGADAAERAA